MQCVNRQAFIEDGNIPALKLSSASQEKLNRMAFLAIDLNQLEVFKALRAQGVQINYLMVATAAKQGKIEFLKYFVSEGYLKSEDKLACSMAASANNLNTLVWLHTNGFGWDFNTLVAAIDANSKECYLYAVNNLCENNPLVEKMFVDKFGSTK